MVLLYDVVQIFAASDFNSAIIQSIVAFDSSYISAALIDII